MFAAETRTRPLVADVPPLNRKKRRDALPEHAVYTDDGCSLSPHCLTCPLAVCRYDDVGQERAKAAHLEERARQIDEMRAHGMNAAAVAKRLQVSRRTVFRTVAIARGREAKK